MAKLSVHAKERLWERFNIRGEDVKIVSNLFNSNYTLVSLTGGYAGEGREIEYNGVSIHGVIKDDVIVTCFEKESYPDPDAYGINRMHNQLENFRLENDNLKKEVTRYKLKDSAMNEVLATKERFMTIADVASTMKTSEITIRRAIKELFPDLIQNGKMTKLTEAHVTAIKLRIEKNHPDKNVEVIRTDLEETLLIKQGYELLLSRTNSLSEENKLLKIENIALAPKAEFYDQVTGSKTAIDMGHAAKVLDMGIGRNKMFQILRDKGVLMADNIPYQTYIDRGYFRIIEQKYVKPDGSINISLKTVVYQRGLDYIRKVIGDNK